MKQEDKELLFKDLCARLPYGVKVWYKYYSDNVTSKFATSIRLVDGKIALSSKFNREGDWYPIEEANELLIKPYLRPMSSMTEEEKNYINYKWDADEYGNMMAFSSYEGGVSEIELADIVGFQDWLNKNMFDYRGLIEKNLALDCTGLHIYD